MSAMPTFDLDWKIREALAVTGQDKPPVNPEPIAALLGYELRWNADIVEHGLVVPGTREILIRHDLPHARKRYTAFHELTHILANDDPSMSHARTAEATIDQRYTVEGRAQRGAAALAFPREWLQQAIKTHGTDPAVLAPLFDMSKKAMEIELSKMSRTPDPRPRSQRYDAHIESEQWKTITRLKLRDAGGKCQWRLDGCTLTRDLDVHHLTYERLGNEWLEDLLVVCRSCHEKWHALRTAASA